MVETSVEAAVDEFEPIVKERNNIWKTLVLLLFNVEYAKVYIQHKRLYSNILTY